MSAILVSTESKDYDEWFLETINLLRKYKIKGLAIVALTDDNDDVLTGYWKMGLKQKQEAKNAIDYDTIDDFIFANIDRYLGGDE